jgi:hypothetical protein
MRSTSPDPHRAPRPAARQPAKRRWYVPFLLAAPLLLTMTHRGRAATDPLEECVEVQQAVERCFGSRQQRPPVYRRPPKDPRERERMRAQCVASRERIERACR